MAKITLAEVAKEFKGSPVSIWGRSNGTYYVRAEVLSLAGAVATARALKEVLDGAEVITAAKVTWQNRIAAASDGRMYALVRCILGFDTTPPGNRRFQGKASITSDGFIMCDFLDHEGVLHHGAFVSSVGEFRENVKGIADFIGLEGKERDEWFAACRAWIADDYSGTGLGL